ncbi:UNVERIFIED_CONTAM: hypothetical protein PYX00_007201 [Menopon gallinae]|uniref:C2HC/C3H-type domain-containing protein n=1 Tax=Menopon gallinae TaxID=328185 RepID=A0AAW2HIA9_9NEOP
MPQSEKPPIGKKAARPAQARPSPQSDLPDCQYCGRHFAEDRIAKHQEICKKSSKTKRKPFDSVKQRVKGTEAEQFLKGGKLRGQPQPPSDPGRPLQKQVKAPQKDWRKTHEDFINSIRAAREYQASVSTTVQSRKPAGMRTSAVSRY